MTVYSLSSRNHKKVNQPTCIGHADRLDIFGPGCKARPKRYVDCVLNRAVKKIKRPGTG